jgi:hypothetical protein
LPLGFNFARLARSPSSRSRTFLAMPAPLSNDLTKIRERITADKQKQTFTIRKLYY